MTPRFKRIILWSAVASITVPIALTTAAAVHFEMVADEYKIGWGYSCYDVVLELHDSDTSKQRWILIGNNERGKQDIEDFIDGLTVPVNVRRSNGVISLAENATANSAAIHLDFIARIRARWLYWRNG